MAQVVVAQRMWQRRDTAANWTSRNPVLAAGEIGVELGANPALPQKFKIGNGSSPWTDLAYGGGSDSAGSVWRDGTTVPDNSLGADGDYYLHTTTGDVYRRTSGAYAVVANIMGADGADGSVDMRIEGGYIQWRSPSSAPWVDLIAVNSLRGPIGPPGPSTGTFPTASFHSINGDVQPGAMCEVVVPFGFEVIEYYLTGDAVGILEVDVRVNSFGAAFPPGGVDTICGSSRPRLIAQRQVQDSVLAGWTTAIASGSTIRFVVTACSGIRAATLVLVGVRA